MMSENHGHAQQTATDTPLPQDDEPGAHGQDIGLTTDQAALQLGVDPRTVRKYIREGFKVGNGPKLYLEAQQVATSRGPEWRIYQSKIDEFLEQKTRAFSEGKDSAVVTRRDENQMLAALNASLQHLAAELESRTQALQEAQGTIERLTKDAILHSYEAGRQVERNEALEREKQQQAKANEALHLRVNELEQARSQLALEQKQLAQEVHRLEQERDQWKQKAQKPKKARLGPFHLTLIEDE